MTAFDPKRTFAAAQKISGFALHLPCKFGLVVGGKVQARSQCKFFLRLILVPCMAASGRLMIRWR
jgi:hypothetical protein